MTDRFKEKGLGTIVPREKWIREELWASHSGLSVKIFSPGILKEKLRKISPYFIKYQSIVKKSDIKLGAPHTLVRPGDPE